MKESPEKRPTLARLPAQEQDAAARDRRKEIESLSLTQEELNAFTHAETDATKVESYAVASFVIEQFWDYLKKHELGTQERDSVLEPLPGEGETIAQQFAHALSTRLNEYRDRFVADLQTSLDAKADGEISKAEALVLRYFSVNVGRGEGLAFPSMNDLVSLIARMADVVPKVYERDAGRASTDEELYASIAHPATKRLFFEMMTNSRDILLPVIARMEGATYADLDDYTRSFRDTFFAIQHDAQGGEYVGFRPEAAQWFRNVFTIVAENRAASGDVPPRALQCPVLYTGKFIEMYDWVADEFAAFHTRNTG